MADPSFRINGRPELPNWAEFISTHIDKIGAALRAYKANKAIKGADAKVSRGRPPKRLATAALQTTEMASVQQPMVPGRIGALGRVSEALANRLAQQQKAKSDEKLTVPHKPSMLASTYKRGL